MQVEVTILVHDVVGPVAAPTGDVANNTPVGESFSGRNNEDNFVKLVIPYIIGTSLGNAKVLTTGNSLHGVANHNERLNAAGATAVHIPAALEANFELSVGRQFKVLTNQHAIFFAHGKVGLATPIGNVTHNTPGCNFTGNFARCHYIEGEGFGIYVQVVGTVGGNTEVLTTGNAFVLGTKLYHERFNLTGSADVDAPVFVLAELELIGSGELNILGNPEFTNGGHVDVFAATPIIDGANNTPAFPYNGFGFIFAGRFILAVHGSAELVSSLVDIKVNTVGASFNSYIGAAACGLTVGSAPVQIPIVVAGELEFGILGKLVVDVEAVEMGVVFHLHVGIGCIPAVESAHDTYVVKAVLGGKDEGSGVVAEEVVAFAVALDILGTAAGDELDGANLGIFGLSFGAPVLGFVVPVVHANKLEATGRTILAEVDKAGKYVSGLFVVVQELVNFFEAPGTNVRTGTDNPNMLVQILILDNGGISGERCRYNVGVQISAVNTTVLVVGHAAFQLEVHGERLIGHAAKGENQ